MTQTFFLLTVAGTLVAFVWMCQRVAQAAWVPVAGMLSAWLVLSGVIAGSGLLTDFSKPVPPLPRMVAITTVITTVFALSPWGGSLARAPLEWLTGLHMFRIAVEIFLWLGYRDGFVPVQMTFEGRNWDVLTGILAGAACWLARRGKLSRPMLLCWNLLGTALLVNIVTIAILSMPTPMRRFFNEPANIFVGRFPYTWLPVFLVQTAWFGHLIVFRRLLARPAGEAGHLRS
ncbi:MAG: hypothetical protein U0Q16_19005 [Bryobacteraceae bacterium]